MYNLNPKIREKWHVLVRKDMDVYEHETLSNITDTNKVKEQIVVRKDMDVYEHETLSNITDTN
jgi:hypothetical protein